MKKLLITAAFACTCIFANAQEMMSKKGTAILPEAGDWSIGAGASDLIMYFGNLFTKDNNNNATLSPQVDQTLVGLYVKDENTAFRVKLRIGFNTTSNDAFTTDATYTGTTTPAPTVTDTKGNSMFDLTIGAGLQKSRGKGRLRGIYGAELFVNLGTDKDSYTYGNSITSTQQTTAAHDFGGNLAGAGRITEDKRGTSFGFGLGAFIGAEYFFAPKMSLSAEYGWGLGLNSTGEGETTSEGWDGTNNALKTQTDKSAGHSSFGLDVSNIGDITLHFYF